jgi:hypothetical protein
MSKSLILAAFFLTLFVVPSIGQAGGKASQWYYAEIRRAEIGRATLDLPGRWDFADKILVEDRRIKDGFSLLSAMNVMSGLGWELVSIYHDDKGDHWVIRARGSMDETGLHHIEN